MSEPLPRPLISGKVVNHAREAVSSLQLKLLELPADGSSMIDAQPWQYPVSTDQVAIELGRLPDDLQTIRAAALLAQALQLTLTELVHEAHESYSWHDIGNALGIGRTAAHKRFGPKTP